MLKSQIIQLERQLLLLNDALGARMSVVLEAENSLQQIVGKVRLVVVRVLPQVAMLAKT